MAGAGGDDTYTVDDVGDVVIELAGGGEDQIRSSVSYELGASVENLTLLGSGNINAIGNRLSNIISGNSASNILIGGIGKDTLTGNGGADSFRFQLIEDSSSSEDQADLITDFSSAQGDLIDFSEIDAVPASAIDNAFTFIGGAEFSSAGQARSYSSGGVTFVALNTNTDLITAELIISITGQESLTAGNFIL